MKSIEKREKSRLKKSILKCKLILNPKKKTWNLFPVLCAIATAARTDVSYCDPNICPPGLTHVACGQDLVCVKAMDSIRQHRKKYYKTKSSDF